MSLFDSLRDKATELFSGASEQVGEVAAGLPGVDAVGEQAAAATGAAEGYAAEAQQLGAEAAAPYTEAAQEFAPYTEAAQEFSPETYRP